MTTPGIAPVGYKHRDGDGEERIMTQWGFNAYTTIEGTRRAAHRLPGVEWFIWRLSDGSYDFTAIEDPTMPGSPVELVERTEWRAR